MSRTYNDYYFEKLDILDTLEKLDMSVRFLDKWIDEPEGLENARYILEKNANRKFNWFDTNMIRELLEEEVRWHINNGVILENF